MKNLTFKKCEDGHYVILDKPEGGSCLGTIELKGEIFPKRVIFSPLDQTEWTTECLQQLIDFIKPLEEVPDWPGLTKGHVTSMRSTMKIIRIKKPKK